MTYSTTWLPEAFAQFCKLQSADLMAIVNYVFPFLPTIVAIKSISVVFDLLLGGFVYKLIHLKYREVFGSIWISCGLFAPTVFLNSWGQAETIYTTF
jgi:Gpi18-like mannosyltransferase